MRKKALALMMALWLITLSAQTTAQTAARAAPAARSDAVWLCAQAFRVEADADKWSAAQFAATRRFAACAFSRLKRVSDVGQVAAVRVPILRRTHPPRVCVHLRDFYLSRPQSAPPETHIAGNARYRIPWEPPTRRHERSA